MKTHIQINQLIEKIDNLKLPLSINRLSCYAADQDGGCANDAAIDLAITQGTLRICLDILPHRCFSFADECERDNQIDEILSEIQEIPEIESIKLDCGFDSMDGKGWSYRIKLK